MAMHESVWAEADGACDEHADIRRRHRADGRLTDEEDAIEAEHFAEVVAARVGLAAFALAVSHAVGWSGPGSPRFRRLLREWDQDRGGVAETA